MPTPYSRVRPIALRVPTAAAKQSPQGRVVPIHGLTSPDVPQRIAEDAKLYGNEPDLKTVKANKNLHQQMQRFVHGAKEASRKLAAAKMNREIELRVFVAPEFYFRPSNADLSFSAGEYQAFCRVMKATLCRGKTFENWMFICGTILWNKTEPKLDRSGNLVGSETIKIFHNSSLILRIYPGEPHATSDLEKAHTASLDGMPFGSPDKETAELYNARKRRQKVAPRIFEMHGVKVGVEICLEHSPIFRELRRRSMSYFSEKRKTPNIDLHVLMAAGMPFYDYSTCAKVGGGRLRVDGYITYDHNRSESGGLTTEKVTGYRRGMIRPRTFPAQMLQTHSTGAPHLNDAYSYGSAPLEVVHTLELPSDLKIPRPAGALQGHWAHQWQGIVIYKHIALTT